MRKMNASISKYSFAVIATAVVLLGSQWALAAGMPNWGVKKSVRPSLRTPVTSKIIPNKVKRFQGAGPRKLPLVLIQDVVITEQGSTLGMTFILQKPVPQSGAVIDWMILAGKSYFNPWKGKSTIPYGSPLNITFSTTVLRRIPRLTLVVRQGNSRTPNFHKTFVPSP